MEPANNPENMEDLLLTFDDLEAGAPVHYDALVLYSEADQAFVEELTRNMPDFRLFTRYRDHLLPNVMPLEVMCKLITTRCSFTILIYSPAFFESLADRPAAGPEAETREETVRRIEAERRVEADRQNRYYADYVLADKIASNARQKMIPCVYQECALPDSFKHNFMLYVNSNAYNFYERLSKALRASSLPPSSAPMIADRPSRTTSVTRRSILRRFMRWCQALAKTQNRHKATR